MGRLRLDFPHLSPRRSIRQIKVRDVIAATGLSRRLAKRRGDALGGEDALA